MKWSCRSLGTAVVLAGSVVAGCASDGAQPYASACGAGDYSCKSHTAFQYRQQAESFGALADRYQREADLQAARLGEQSPEVQNQRKLAQQYRAESEQADAVARELRRELPHNVVQY